MTKIGNPVFYYCSNLKDITFTGTRAQWKAILKNSAWKGSYTASFTVYCTDGDLTGEEV